MKLGDAGTLALAIIAFAGLLVAIVSWFFRRGADEREMTIALKQNTTATTELTSAFHSFRSEVVDDLHSLDVRVTKLEAHDFPAHRNSSSAGGR